MSLLLTPGQLTGRSEFFHQLSQVTASGLGLIAALELLHRNPPRPSLREPISALLHHLQHGETFGGALATTGRWLSTFDVALIQAGEKSGRLPDVFRVLSAYYAQRAQLARQVIAFAAYPLLTFHVAVLVFPIKSLTGLVLEGAVIAFLVQKLAVLLPVYGIALLCAYAMQGTRGESWRAAIEGITARVPILGTARRNLAIARLSLALDALLSAGVGMIEAWRMAAQASGSPALGRAVERFIPQMEIGSQPSEMVIGNSEFPRAFAQLYQTGEMTGRLDDTLKRTYAFYEEEGSRKLRTFIFGLAGLLVGCVMLLAAWNIISFYLGYFKQIDDAINMNAK